MNKLNSLFVFFILLSFLIPPILFEQSFAQENQIISSRHQWKQSSDPESLTCKQSLILLQKANGVPACVSSVTYIKLVDRGYGKFNSSQLMNRPDMMTLLMGGMVNDSKLMHHWHNMTLNDPKILQKTMDEMVLQLEENKEYITNILGQMIKSPELRKQMIEQMESHSQMTDSLQSHSEWMESVHQPTMKSNMNHEMNSETHENIGCAMCSKTKQHDLHANKGFHDPKIMEDLIHHIWINEKMRTKMQILMLKNPIHLNLMVDQLMNPLLGLMMDNPEIRNKMIEIMLENQDFMDSIRHENKLSN
jgi:hypothetical protein